MPCTTILVGKRASYDGSTIIARNEDAQNGSFTPKRMAVVLPQDQPRVYQSVISQLQIDLSDLTPQRYSSVPNALLDEGLWASAGVNESNVAMSATETITSNPRVLGADPLVALQPAQGTPGEDGYQPAVAGGIGEEDFVTLVLPYITSAREGVLRLGALLERYGTYEMNGIAFSDTTEIWWMETIGGHHWIARRVPDDCYVCVPNQLGIDHFDLFDAEGTAVNYMCSSDLRAWMSAHHLDLTVRRLDETADTFNPRSAFGSASDFDHIYNTPRAWAMQRHLNAGSNVWDGPDADFTPESDDIPWCRRPNRLLTIEDVKYVLSLHYQGTPFDCYGGMGTDESRRRYRPIGINRNCQLAVLQLRPYVPAECCAVQWMAFGSNPFNALVPLYAAVDHMPAYFTHTPAEVSTESFYWTNRLIAALADGQFGACAMDVERYQMKVASLGHALLAATDAAVSDGASASDAGDAAVPSTVQLLEAANQRMADDLRHETEDLLAKVLYTASMAMRNRFERSDG